MTFYELEKKCKQRRLRKIILSLIFSLIIIFVVILGYRKININSSINYKGESVEKVNVDKEKNKALLMPIIPQIELESNVDNKPKVESHVEKVKDNVLEVEYLPPYEECINLAKKYLKEREYNLALKWAKNANIQNKILPDSWIISAKALFYSGKKEKAIEILKIYLKYNKNKRVESLLREFENEKNN